MSRPLTLGGRRFLAGLGATIVLIFGWAGQAMAQTATPSPTPTGLDTALVKADLASGGFWLTLLVALVFGAAGGVVYELLILQGNIELPHRPVEGEFTERPSHAVAAHMLDLGIWARVVIGSLAALAALLVVSPTNTLRLIATSIVAGSAGTAVFRSVQDRLLAALAQKDAAETKERARKQTAKVAAAKQRLQEHAAAVGAGGGAESFEVGGDRGPGPPAAFAEVERLLAEAEGIGETI